ncbi:MAG: hypothetical protein ACIAQF_07915 [Phycisphaerales bacterium JB065]
MFKNALLVLTLGAMMTAATPAPLFVPTSAAVMLQDSNDAEQTEDLVIFVNGRVVRGDILEETDTTIIMNVRIGSMPAVKTVYEKDQILEIQRDVPRETDGQDGDAGGSGGEAGTSAVIPEKNTRGEDINEDTTLFYVAKLDGVFERDLTETPLRQLFKDIDETFDDLVEVPSGSGGSKFIVDEKVRDKHVVVLKIDATTDYQGFDGLFTAERVTPIFKDELQKGRRIVFWVDRALGGVAFVPWLSSEMYVTPDSTMGLAGDLDDFDIGDELVNLKQISLRMGHAEGIVVYGGYGRLGVAIIQAMARGQYWFAVRLTGVEPEFYISVDKPGPEIMANPQWILLSDNGQDEYEDDPDATLYGNDTLILRDDILLKLGIADGVASSVEDIAMSMRVFRNYAVLENTQADRILDRWSEEVQRAMINFQRIFAEARQVPVGIGDDALMAALGRQQRLLRQARGILTRYAEVLDQDGNIRAEIDVMIEQIRARMRNLRNGGRGGGGGGAGGGAGGGR